MEREVDELNLEMQHNQFEGVYSFPYQLQTPKLSPYLLNHFGDQALEMPQSFKYLYQIYPLNQTIQARQQQMKRFFGIKYLFGLEGKNQNDFLEDIDAQMFNVSFFDNPNLVDLSKFFQQEEKNSQQNQHKKLLDDLTKKLSEIQNKAFTGISIHKTVGKAFFQHFNNFLFLRNQSSFFQNFQISFEKLFLQSKNVRKSGQNLILMIYQFWMRMFRQFIRQIWRHSEKYSLDMFKKNKRFQGNRDYQQSKSSTSSSQQQQKIQKEKRKLWSKDQIQILQKIISSKAVLNNFSLHNLAQEFGRSPNSISSKIQKITKLRKTIQQNEGSQDLTMDKKIQLILKLHPSGLSKQQVIKKVNQTYEMGSEDNWKKSVCQMLSSKKNLQKIKGSFRLINPPSFLNYSLSETLKDKLIRCLLQCQNYEGDLKTLSQKYLQIFGLHQRLNQQDKEKLKSIQTNISKCLNRYDIFQKSNEKIIYKLNQTPNSIIQYSMDVQEYMD